MSRRGSAERDKLQTEGRDYTVLWSTRAFASRAGSVHTEKGQHGETDGTDLVVYTRKREIEREMQKTGFFCVLRSYSLQYTCIIINT